MERNFWDKKSHKVGTIGEFKIFNHTTKKNEKIYGQIVHFHKTSNAWSKGPVYMHTIKILPKGASNGENGHN